MQKLKMIPCPKCGTDFPELRKTLYNYHVCVNCSTTKPVVGITTVEGSGDHTYNDIIIMDQDKYISIAKKEAELAGKRANVNIEYINFDDEPMTDHETSQSLKDATSSINEGAEENEYDAFDPNKEPEGIQGIDY